MLHPWHDVTPGIGRLPLPGHFRVVVEIPRGASNKYELDKASGLLRLDRVLHSSVHYPANYGFIPQTLAEDGDPLDALVFCSEPAPPLCLCDARAVGLMIMVDDGQADHKIIATLINDPQFADYREAADFPRHTFRMLRRFFEDYKALEGKQVAVYEIQPAAAAMPIIEAALQRYDVARRQGLAPGLHG